MNCLDTGEAWSPASKASQSHSSIRLAETEGMTRLSTPASSLGEKHKTRMHISRNGSVSVHLSKAKAW